MGGEALLWLPVLRIAAHLGGEHMAQSIVVGVGSKDFLLTRKRGSWNWVLGDDLQKSIPRDLLPSPRSHVLRYPRLPPNNHQLLHKPVDHESPGDISSKTSPTPEPHPLGEAVQGKLLPLWVTEEPEGKPGRTRTKSSRSIRQSKSPANPNHHPKGHRRTGMMTQCSGATCRLFPPPPLLFLS